MDSLTHTVLGACLGEIIAGKKIGKKAMLFGAIANNFPDIDVITSFWMSPQDGVLAHRGFTHSILFALLATPLLSYAAQKFLKKTTLSFTQWLGLIGSGLLVHILIDACTAYGTGWFEPFSHIRVSFNTLFILDPFILLVCLVTALVLLVLKRNHAKRNVWARNTVIICGLYLLVAFSIKLFVDSKVEENIAGQHINAYKYMATPAPLSSLLWFVAIKSGNGFYTGYYSLFDKAGPMHLEFTNSNDLLIAPYKGNAEVQKIERFTKGYYCYNQHADTITFSDMRFGKLQGWSKKNAPFVFRFYLCKSEGNSLIVKRTPIEPITKDAFTTLFDRIKGNDINY